MLKTKQKNKLLFTIVISSIIIILGLLGSKWQLGFAEDVPSVPTVPTIPIIFPTVYNYQPQQICVNSADTIVTVHGYDFIDTTNTWIVWVDSFYVHSYIKSDEITVDNPTSMYLKFTVDATKLTHVGDVWFYIDNYPEIQFGLAGPFWIEIIGCNNIYLPLVVK
ncbi:MAG: hypothetical protein K0B14_12345 [Anaerolineaceae bacterium]|nr:hypothetical protein [Anaerolineaceae bacterium]